MTSLAKPATALLRFAAALGLAAALLAGCASREEKIAEALATASAAVDQNKASEAIAILEKAIADNPKHAPLNEALGSAQLVNGNTEKAIAAFRSAVEADPMRTRLWIRISELQQSSGKIDDAIRSAETYLTNHPKDFLAWKSVAQMRRSKGESAAATDAALKWNQLRPSADPALLLGSLFQEGKNIPQARSWFAQAAAYKNEDGAKEALAKLIELEASLSQHIPAQTFLKEYAARYGGNPSDPRIQNAMATIEKWEKDKREIAEVARKLDEQRKALELKRETDRLAAEAAKQPKPAEADSVPEKPAGDPNFKAPSALAGGSASKPAPAPVQPDNPVAQGHLLRAEEALRQNNHAAAIAHYWNALGADSANAATWQKTAVAYAGQQQWADARACILEARNRAPDSAAIAADYLIILARTGDAQVVAAEADALQRQFPTEAQIALAAARALNHAAADRQRVADAYRSVLKLTRPGSAAAGEANRFLSSGN